MSSSNEYDVALTSADDMTLVRRCRLPLYKPVLNAPMVSALETKYDEALSNIAFKFNLRRHTLAATNTLSVKTAGYAVLAADKYTGAVAGAYTRPLLSST
jgi:hypothetical protein